MASRGLLAGLFAWYLVATEAAEAPSECSPENLRKWPTGWPKFLDASLYWMGPNGEVEHAQGNISGGRSAHYDPGKPTLIYFHGWAGGHGGWTAECHRMDTKCPTQVCGDVPNTDVMATWFTAGWNIGYFMWEQFADRECLRDAEQMIWFDYANNGLTWKSYDPSNGVAQSNHYAGTAWSVTDICASNVGGALANFAGPQLRFVGHSIGAQLAASCSLKLHAQGSRGAPTRLALLEPYFSNHPLHIFRCIPEPSEPNFDFAIGMGDYASRKTAEVVTGLWTSHQVPTEVYKSSVLTESNIFGYVDEAIETKVALVEYDVDFCGMNLIHLECRHNFAYSNYFLEMTHAPPPLVAGSNVAYENSGCTTPSSACSDEEIRALVQRQISSSGTQVWHQVAGKMTMDPADDTFRLSLRVTQPHSFLQRWKAIGDIAQVLPQSVPVAGALTATVLLSIVGGLTIAVRRYRKRSTSPREEFLDLDGDAAVTVALATAEVDESA